MQWQAEHGLPGRGFGKATRRDDRPGEPGAGCMVIAQGMTQRFQRCGIDGAQRTETLDQAPGNAFCGVSGIGNKERRQDGYLPSLLRRDM